jgi:hypothetical protein
MQKNIGGLDKNIRLGAGAALVLLSLLGILKPAFLFILIGAALLGTAFLGHCPAYVPLKINTRNPDNKEH